MTRMPMPRRTRPWRDYALFLVLVGPDLALLLLFIYRPLADNIRLSFFDWNISDPTAQFIGLSNYAEWFTRSDTRQIVLNTAVFTVATVIGSMVLGLVLAMLLDQPLRGRNLVRSTVFAPFVISGAAVGLAAQFVFDPHFGLVQDLLHRIGVGVPDFYQDPHWAMFMVTVTYIWKNLGYTFVIYLAALQGVRRDLLEAAEIDGAGRWATFTPGAVAPAASDHVLLIDHGADQFVAGVRRHQRHDPGRPAGHRHHDHGVPGVSGDLQEFPGRLRRHCRHASCSWCCWPSRTTRYA